MSEAGLTPEPPPPSLSDINWQRPRFYLVPKSNLYLAIQRACEELAITYHLPDQPILLKKVGPP